MNSSASAARGRQAAVYARVSTAEQVDGTSLSTQVERCRAYIESQGWALVGEFVDEGVSGAKATRPALERLLGLVRSGGVDAIVVAKLDRLGRSMRHLVVLLAELDDRGVRLVSVAEGFDSQTPAGRLQRNILGSFAEFEREQIRERTTSGLLAVAREGFWPGGPPPYGWRLVTDGRHTRVEVDPAEAAVVRAAAEMIVVEGLRLNEVAKRLNASGSRPRSGRSWTRVTLRWVLSGPLAGEWHYAPTSGSRRHPGEGLSVLHGPEILPSPLREALDHFLSATERGRRPEWYPYMLSGCFEALCGDQYTGEGTPKQGPGYRCRRRARASLYGGQRCECRRVPAQLVEPVVWDGLVQLLSDEDRLRSMAEIWLSQAMAPAGIEADSLEAVERRIGRLEANLARSVADYLRQGVPGDAVRLATAEVAAEVEQLKAYRDRLRAVARGRAAVGRQVSELVALAREALGTASPDERRRVARLFGLKVQLLGWDDCPRCHGSGKVSSSRHGVRCPVCLGTRGLPVLRVTGEVDPAVLSPGEAVHPPLPFSVDLKPAV